MKLTYGEIFNAKVPVGQLAALKLPVTTSIALVKLGQKLGEHLAPIEEVRAGLIRTYGKADPEKGNQVSISPGADGWPKFVVEYEELMSQEVEVVIEPISLPDTLEIEPAVLMPLIKFIKIAPKK